MPSDVQQFQHRSVVVTCGASFETVSLRLLTLLLCCTMWMCILKRRSPTSWCILKRRSPTNWFGYMFLLPRVFGRSPYFSTRPFQVKIAQAFGLCLLLVMLESPPRALDHLWPIFATLRSGQLSSTVAGTDSFLGTDASPGPTCSSRMPSSAHVSEAWLGS